MGVVLPSFYSIETREKKRKMVRFTFGIKNISRLYLFPYVDAFFLKKMYFSSNVTTDINVDKKLYEKDTKKKGGSFSLSFSLSLPQRAELTTSSNGANLRGV